LNTSELREAMEGTRAVKRFVRSSVCSWRAFSGRPFPRAAVLAVLVWTFCAVLWTPHAEAEHSGVAVSGEQELKMDTFRFVGNRLVGSEELERVSGLETGTLLSGPLLDSVLERLVTHMADRGFPFAATRAGDFALTEKGVNLVFFIEEGPLCTVSDVELGDSDALKSEALQRALGVSPGERYCEKNLGRGVKALRRTGLFSKVGEPVLSLCGVDGVRITVPVEEKKTTHVAGALGFRGRTGEMTGGLSLALLNIARTGRSAQASWEAMGRNVSTFNLSYAEPWVMGLPFSSSLSIEHVVRDTLFARTSVSFLCKVPLSSVFSAEAGASLEKATNTDGPNSRTSRIAWLGGIEFVTGEPHWEASNSFLGSLRGSRGTKKTTHLSDETVTQDVFTTMQTRVLLQRRVGRSQIALADVKASAILDGLEAAALDELFSLGGKRTLRGYSERQFLAGSVGSVQFEYGVLVGGGSGRAFLLVDFGYASTQALSFRERIHAGYGAGLRVPSSFGVVGIDFAVPAGEPLSSGKIHVGLEGTF
jgi:outer membrane protein assembly factor BamA